MNRDQGTNHGSKPEGPDQNVQTPNPTAAADRTTVLHQGPPVDRDKTRSASPSHHLHQTLGPYTIVSLLGTGGMALVYEATIGSDQHVALKVMQETPFLPAVTLERFRREAESAAILGDHPGIVSVLDTGNVGRDHYIAMELVPGGRTLEALLDPPPRAINDILNVTIKVASALAHAHDCGIIHRDIKPGNILLAPSGNPLLADFGLARSELDAGRNLTISAMTMGTPRYMSPEQIASTKHTTPLSDMYSFGVILYELLTGQLPYPLEHDLGVAEILDVVTSVSPRDPRSIRPEISNDLAAVVLKMLEKSPRDRYADLHAVAADLQACLEGSKVTVRVPTPLERFDRTVRRHPWITLAAVAGTMLSVGSWTWHHKALVKERGIHTVPKARAISEARQVENMKRQLSSRPAPDPAHERALRRARLAILRERDLEQAERLLAPLAAAPGGGEVARVARRDVARLRLARQDWSAAEAMFADLAKSYQLIRDARRLKEKNPTLNDPRMAFALFEQAIAADLAGNHSNATQLWTQARREAAPETPLGTLCAGALGIMTPEQTAAFGTRTGGAFRALAFWLASRKTDNPGKAETWRIQASDAAKSGLPWLYYRLRGNVADQDAARGNGHAPAE